MLEHMYNKNTLQIFYLILMLSIQFVEEYVLVTIGAIVIVF